MWVKSLSQWDVVGPVERCGGKLMSTKSPSASGLSLDSSTSSPSELRDSSSKLLIATDNAPRVQMSQLGKFWHL